jgi:hypothetical protein
VSYYTDQYNKDIPFSNKISMSMNIKKYLIDRINSNQDIVRCCRYLTKTPLLEMGINYNDEVVEQPDLDCGLLENLGENRNKDGEYEEYKNVESRNKILIPYASDNRLMTKDQLFIFVSNSYIYSNTYKSTSEYTFDIVVTYSSTYNILEPYGDERSLVIIDRICNMFDEMYPEKSEYAEDVGDFKFFVRSIDEQKIGANGTMVRTIKLTCQPITDRRVANYA